MLKTYAKLFKSIWIVLDVTIMTGIFIFSFYLRIYHLPFYHPSMPVLSNYLEEYLLFAGLWIIFANNFDVYVAKRLYTPAADWLPMILTTAVTLLVFSAISFLLKPLDISRLLLALFSVSLVLVLGLWHTLMRLLLAALRAQGFNQRRAVIVGWNTLGHRVAETFRMNPGFGFQVLGYLDDIPAGPKTGRYRHLGKISSLEHFLGEHDVDRVMLTLPLNENEKIRTVAAACEHAGVELNIVPELTGIVRPHTKVFDLDGLPVIGVRHTPVDSFQYMWLKRLFDIAASAVVLILCSPLMVLISAMIKITSKGPVIFKQRRIGYNGKEFMFYKFRTMATVDDHVSDTTWLDEDKDRRTRFGKVLRFTSLDELPQFWNVLKGDMSIVGPRPERPYFIEKFKQDIPSYMVRHVVKAGITGWAQIHGWRGDTSIKRRIEYDLQYIENWTFWLDLKIIFLTPFKGLYHK